MNIKGDIVKRYVFRGKFVIICRIETEQGEMYSFKISDKGSKKDYFNNKKYEDFESCDRDAYKVVKGV